MNVFRIFRLMRLLKLLRILKSARVLKRMESRISVSFAALSLIKFVIAVLLISHWLACLLRLTVEIEMVIVPELADPATGPDALGSVVAGSVPARRVSAADTPANAASYSETHATRRGWGLTLGPAALAS